jgi:hypothetical protein
MGCIQDNTETQAVRAVQYVETDRFITGFCLPPRDEPRAASVPREMGLVNTGKSAIERADTQQQITVSTLWNLETPSYR